MDEENRLDGAPNAFDPAFLDVLEQLSEVETGAEVEFGGPWKIEATADGYALLRVWETAGAGEAPEALLASFHDALRFFAVLPALGRDPRISMAQDEDSAGFALRGPGGPVGFLRLFNDELMQAVHVADCLTRSPLALSALLIAAGPQAIQEVGRILRRVAASQEDGRGVLGLELRP